jgi:threonyl-tRNA synthetase
MLHRAIVGSMERFIGILIENYAGAMPAWLAPVQAVVSNISEHSMGYAREVANALREAGLRAVADLRNEKISYKIREHSLQKLPYQVIVGDQELAASQVAIRTRKGVDLGRMSVEAFISRLKADEARKGRAAEDGPTGE